MASDVLGFNFADTADVTWTLTDDDPVDGVTKVEAAVVGGGGGGTVWYVGSAAPSTLHNDGDFYLRTTNGEVYKQVSGAWVDQMFSLLGPTGATGATGATGSTGATGAAGSQIFTGSGAPSTGLGVVGDFYIRFTGALYKKTGSSTWTDQGAPTKQILAAWAGTMPVALGNGLVWVVPQINATTATFSLSYAIARVETTPLGSSAQFVLEKSSGGNSAFSGSPTTVSTLTIAPADYRNEDTGVSLSVSSGDLLRLRFAALGGLGGACAYSIELQGSQTA